MVQANQIRTYEPGASVVFLKTNERFGGLSNMAPGFPLRVNGVRIRTSEALYQACRFPHLPDVQRKIIDEHSPMTAKMRSKPFRKDSRSDWDFLRVKIMRWCLRVKLAQNRKEFGRLLLATGDRPIVEQSRKDDFWGAKVAEDGSLVGMNVLGRLLMELREQLKGDAAENLRYVEPLAIPDFLLLRRPIETICATDATFRPVRIENRPLRPVAISPPREVPQPSLFDQPIIARGPMDIQMNRAAAANSSRDPKPYSRYRESGLPWLGQIPEHWDVRRNGRLFAERNQTGFEDLPILEVSLRTGVRVRNMENGARKQQMTDRSKYKRAAKGDIAYNMMRMWQGAVGVAPVDGLISPAYVVARPFPEVEPRYYAYLFRTAAYMREVNKFSRGIVSDRNRLYWGEFKQMPAVFPPTEEQTRIADLLDAHGHLTARLIRNKRRRIGLLNEQKQAIINQAVVRGLDPKAQMKPTGIYWMPDVPEHWKLKRFKYLTNIQSGQVDPRLDEHKGKVLIAPNHIRAGAGQIIEFHTADAQGADSGKYEVRSRDIVYSKIRPHLRKAAISPIDCLCSADMYPIRVKEDEFIPRFFLLLLLSNAVTRYTVDCSMRVAMPKINREALGDCWLAYPSLTEQKDILDWLESETASLDAATERTQQQIELICEYRDRLIADVVTGKQDVRHIAIPTTADGPAIDELEELDEELETDGADVMEEFDGGE